MSYQLSSFGRCLIKLLFYYILFIIIYLIVYFVITTRPLFPVDRSDLTMLLGINFKAGFSFIFALVQLLITLLTFQLFIKYDGFNSPEFSLLRLPAKKILFQKLIVIIPFIFIWRSMYFIFNYYLFSKKVPFIFKDYLLCILIHIILIVIIYLYYRTKIYWKKQS